MEEDPYLQEDLTYHSSLLLAFLIANQDKWKPEMEVRGGRGGAIVLPVTLIPRVVS